jgi:GntR family transcriptional regulator
LPRYHQIYLVLRDRLTGGEFAGHAPLPGEHALAKTFGVSRVTVRAALERLERDRLIERRHGRGTFARSRSTPLSARAPLSGLLENIVAMGLRTTVRILELCVTEAPPDVAEVLRLGTGEKVQRAVRVRSYKGAPVSHITTFVPAAIARFGRRELSTRPMLQLLEDFGIQVAAAEQTISARLCDPAVAPLLDLSVGSPLLAVTRTVSDTSGKPVQLLRGLYRPDRYEYRMQLTRAAGDMPRVWVSNESSKDPR